MHHVPLTAMPLSVADILRWDPESVRDVARAAGGRAHLMGRRSAVTARSLGSTITTRRILYVGEDLATSASEVFGESGTAQICPRYRTSRCCPTSTPG
jgi:hypothetical protein